MAEHTTDMHVTKPSLLFSWSRLNKEDLGYLAFPSTLSMHNSNTAKVQKNLNP